MSNEISGVIIAKNEERELRDCLAAWSHVCDALILVDDQSTDNTSNVARSIGAHVINASMDCRGFSGLRNTGLEAVQTSHALVFDADERPSALLLRSIHKAAQTGMEGNAYSMLRRNAAFGGWLDHGRFRQDWTTRLFPRDTRYNGTVHEVPYMGESTSIIRLEGAIEHRTYADLDEYMRKMRDYAVKQSELHEPPSILHMMAIPFYNLLVRQGYKDGWRGLAMAIGDGWYNYLLRQYSRMNRQESTTQLTVVGPERIEEFE